MIGKVITRKSTFKHNFLGGLKIISLTFFSIKCKKCDIAYNFLLCRHETAIPGKFKSQLIIIDKILEAELKIY